MEESGGRNSPLHSQLLVDSLAGNIYPGQVEHYEVGFLCYLVLELVRFSDVALFYLPGISVL